MKKRVLIPVLAFLLAGCSSHSRWSDRQRKDFSADCSRTDTVKNLVLSFSGFGPGEVDTIRIEEYDGTSRIDSFTVPLETTSSNQTSDRVYATVGRPMSLNHAYRIFIPGQTPHELTQIKMVMWPEYAGSSEGWGCIMGDFTLDGVRFENNANIDIKKGTLPE